jgi:acetyltransferase-like isoleucine patch superfamily enzyme
MAFSLNKLLRIQRLIVRARIAFYNGFWGTQIDPSAVLSLKCRIDRTHPKGIHIGADTYVAFGASILSHDMVRALKTNTFIGKNCFIGAQSLILPGVRVGDHAIVAAGSVVVKDVPPHSIVAGNPARIIRENIETKRFGILVQPD